MPSNRRLVGLSTKMYFSLSKTKQYTDAVISQLASVPAESLSNVDIFILPDFIAIPTTVSQLSSSSVPIWTGAQDSHWEDQGAFTGEVSPQVLKDAGARIAAVGHAERRRLFGETDEIVAKKAAAVSRNGLIPLVCIGEKTKGDVKVAVDECQVQVDSVIAGLDDGAEVVLAYEPVWAIGASEPAGVEHVLAVVDGLRNLDSVKNRKGVTRVVYGGSAGPGLFEKLKSGLDGLFLGRFAHDPERFVQTVKEVAT